jgi:hypothetical protein
MLAVRTLAPTLLFLLVSVARANDPADALIDEGLDLREKGKDEEALSRFRRAYAIDPTPRAKAQIGLCEQALGRWVRAELDVSEALASASDGWIAKHKTALDGALATIRSHVGDLVILGGPDGAQVRVDGADMGALPVKGPLRLEIGSHTLEVSDATHYPFSQPVVIRADSATRVSLEMRERTQTSTETTDTRSKPTTTTQATSTGSPLRVVGIALAATSVIPIVFGVAGLVVRQSQISSYNDDPSCPGIDMPNKPAACQSRVDAADTWQTVSIVGFAVGGALLVAGVIIAIAAPSTKSVALRSNGIAFVF